MSDEDVLQNPRKMHRQQQSEFLNETKYLVAHPWLDSYIQYSGIPFLRIYSFNTTAETHPGIWMNTWLSNQSDSKVFDLSTANPYYGEKTLLRIPLTLSAVAPEHELSPRPFLAGRSLLIRHS